MCFMISQPMANLSESEILDIRIKAEKVLTNMGHTVLYTYFRELPPSCVQNDGLFYLGMSLAEMSKCDGVYFCKGWKEARGCKIEHDAALAYGLEILYE